MGRNVKNKSMHLPLQQIEEETIMWVTGESSLRTKNPGNPPPKTQSTIGSNKTASELFPNGKTTKIENPQKQFEIIMNTTTWLKKSCIRNSNSTVGSFD